jgi:hypothetical protein
MKGTAAGIVLNSSLKAYKIRGGQTFSASRAALIYRYDAVEFLFEFCLLRV